MRLVPFNNNPKRVTALLILWLCAHIAFSQSTLYKNYSLKDGLPSSEDYNVMQDSKGYMWFCSDGGVARFNGYEFKVFNISNGIPDEDIFQTYEDYKGRIWFRSFSGKLSYYYNDSIFCLPINDTLGKLLKNVSITSISVDTLDNIYMGIAGPLPPLKIDMRHKFAISFLNVKNFCTYLLINPSGGIITGNHAHVYPPHKKPKTLFAVYGLNPGSSQVKMIKQFDTLNIEESGKHDRVVKMPDGNIAFSLGSQFLVMNSHFNIIYSSPLHSLILDLADAPGNKVWLTTADLGPLCYANKQIISYPNLHFLNSKRLTSVAVDDEGGIWFTNLYDGVFYVPSLEFNVWNTENGLPGNKVDILNIAPDSTLWISVTRNNTMALLHNNTLSYRSIPDLPGVTINSVLSDNQNSTWMGTSNGVYITKTNTPSGSFIHPTEEGGNTLVLNSDSSVWYCEESKLIHFKKNGNSIITLYDTNWHTRIHAACSNHGKGLWVDAAGSLWKCNNHYLVNCTNNNNELKGVFAGMREAPNGVLWMSSEYSGVVAKCNKRVFKITKANGLLSNYCSCICPDNNGNIWVGTRTGLSYLVLDKNTPDSIHINYIRNISTPNLKEINCIVCSGNTIYVGTNSGLTSFNRDALKSDSVPPQVYITAISVNNKPVNAHLAQLNLGYDENYISVHFTGLSYINAGDVEYKYKMAGIDTGWVYTKSTAIQYPKLQPGKYSFWVSAMNNNGIWSRQPASFSITIFPAWWNTWWARAFAFILIAALVYWRIKVIRANEERKTEINKQLAIADLQKLRAQFDPHFLFNNLNTLSSLISSTPDHAQDFVDELSQFYQYTIRHSKQEFTDLASETEQAKRYCNLLAIRFGKHLVIDWNISPGYAGYLILTNSLQILLENVVKHNNILTGDKFVVDIFTTPFNTIVVTNHVFGKRNIASTGTGLNNINERYRLLTGKSIIIEHTSDTFSVELPLLIPQEYGNINSRR